MRDLVLVASLVLCLFSAVSGGELQAGASASALVAIDSMVIGGGIAPQKVVGQEGELRASALVLQDPRGTKAALIACDVLMISRDILDQAARRIEHELGIPFDQILSSSWRTTTSGTSPIAAPSSSADIRSGPDCIASWSQRLARPSSRNRSSFLTNFIRLHRRRFHDRVEKGV
jgi:hypothetical protein